MGSLSDQEGLAKVHFLIPPENPDIFFQRLRQAVNPETVFLLMDDFYQGPDQALKLHFIDFTFKDAFLHPLAEVFALLRHPAQAAAARRRLP